MFTINEQDLAGNYVHNTDCPLARSLRRHLPSASQIIVYSFRVDIDDVTYVFPDWLVDKLIKTITDKTPFEYDWSEFKRFN